MSVLWQCLCKCLVKLFKTSLMDESVLFICTQCLQRVSEKNILLKILLDIILYVYVYITIYHICVWYINDINIWYICVIYIYMCVCDYRIDLVFFIMGAFNRYLRIFCVWFHIFPLFEQNYLLLILLFRWCMNAP